MRKRNRTTSRRIWGGSRVSGETKVPGASRASGTSRVSALGEFGLIERILSRFSAGDTRYVRVGPGDDAAVLDLGSGARMVVTTDMLVEGTHFRLGWSFPEAVGYKAVTSNLSDIAAVGGIPAGVVVSLGVPAAVPVVGVDRLYKGVSLALARFGGELLGGDTVRSDRITVCVSAVGRLVGRKPLLRSGARPGHSICVTGALGASEAGLLLLRKYFRKARRSRKAELTGWAERTREYFRTGLPSELRRDGTVCIMRHLMPGARTPEVQLIAASRPSSMIDLSDGLSSDLLHIARASGVGLELQEARIPVHPSAERIVTRLGGVSRRTAIASGEEYELLFTIPASRVKTLSNRMDKSRGTHVTEIGRVTTGGSGAAAPGELRLLTISGRRRKLTPIGFRHF